MAAREVDLFLENSSLLPVTGGIVKRSAPEILRQITQQNGHALNGAPQFAVEAQ
jgi:hypothetical protein